MMKATVFAVMALALTACTAPQAPRGSDVAERVVDGPAPAAPAPRGDAALRTAMLTVHNRARAAVGTAPLVWDATLASHAATWAQTLAASGRMRHADQPQGPGREGENLFTGTRDAYRLDEMAQLWVDERRDFVNRPTPQFSTTGRWQDVGHYTQIIWHSTTRVGCANASNARDDFLVCRYSPPGNVYGEQAYR